MITNPPTAAAPVPPRLTDKLVDQARRIQALVDEGFSYSLATRVVRANDRAAERERQRRVPR